MMDPTIGIYWRIYVFLKRHVIIPFDSSKRFTLHPSADMFIPTPTSLGSILAMQQLRVAQRLIVSHAKDTGNVG